MRVACYGIFARDRPAGLFDGRVLTLSHVRGAPQSLVSVGVQVLVGAGGVVLGILALVGIMPIVMVLIGLLASGASILLRSALAARSLNG